MSCLDPVRSKFGFLSALLRAHPRFHLHLDAADAAKKRAVCSPAPSGTVGYPASIGLAGLAGFGTPPFPRGLPVPYGPAVKLVVTDDPRIEF